MATMSALLILLPPFSVLLLLAARNLGRVAARNLSALARVQFACLPAASGGVSSFRPSRKSIVSEDVLRVAPYRKKKEEDDDDEKVECVVCLTGIKDGDEIRELKCRHLFHRSCLDRWLARPVVATCPLCRCRLLTPAAEEQRYDLDGGEEDGEESSDMMLFMACVHGRSSWFWPTTS